jgi:hypothetical protein
MSPLQLPQRDPYGEACPFPEPSFKYLSTFTVNGPPPPHVPQRGPYGENYSFPEPSSKHRPIKIISPFPGNGPSLHVPPTGPQWRAMLRLQSQWLIHSFISLKSPQLRSPSTKWRGNTRSPSAEPQAYGRGSFTTLLSLPQCHAAFRTIPSTLA